jgi:branched-chain amino acid transport system ATP-binding protein
LSEMLLRVEDINTYYGDFHAVQGASFDVKEGEIVSIIGTNGAGKSTLIKTIVGILVPQSGKVFYKGQDVTGYQTHKLVDMGIAVVPEGGKVFSRMSVEDNLAMGSYTKKRDKIKIKY